MRKLMGHLAQFASFSKQGELLCTQSLAFLLMDTEAKRTFSAFLGLAAGLSISEALNWRTEHCQNDGRRPDIEGYRADGKSEVKIEGKLDAEFGKGQLASYIADLFSNDFPSSLIVLVPHNRFKEAVDHTALQFSLQGEGPWQVRNVSIAVITWEDLLQSLGTVANQEFREDLTQLYSMYRALNGDDMEPLTTDEEVLLWREKENWWQKLVDHTTRRLSPLGESVLPFNIEKTEVPYYRRYICRNILGIPSCYSIGTRDPFQNHRTPVWLRFHKGTGHFATISQQLVRSELASAIVHSGKHIWYPLNVPYNAEREVMIDSLVAQATHIASVAYQFTTPRERI